MNGLMKHVVDIAFRMKAWDKAKTAALRASHAPPPIPPAVGTFLRGLVGCKQPLAGGAALWAGLGEEQKRTIVRASVTLAWFAQTGCPIVSLDEGTAKGFARSPPPGDVKGTEWKLGGAYGLTLGPGAALVRHAFVSTKMPEALRADFDVHDGIVPIEAWFVGTDLLDSDEALLNLTENVGAALSQRPEGVTVTERRPSSKAARKQGLRPDRLAGVEYIIGSDVILGRPVSRESHLGSSAGHATQVRTAVTGHWKHQTCGPWHSQRRLQWIASHWRGPEDAPVSVHATRVTAKGPGRQER
jgi:hypothetical protein